MKRTSLVIIAILVLASFAFSQESYTMFENTYLFVKTDKQKEFSEAIAKHNQKYHADGPHHANMWMVTGGHYSGAIVNSMGPCTFTELDTRPASKDHNEDWSNNVMPHVKKLGETGYWKLAEKLSYQPEDSQVSKLLITVYDIEPWQSYRFKEVMKKVSAVYKEKAKDKGFSVYWPAFDMANGRDVATVWGFNDFAVFDEEWKFKSDYEEVHGEGSWQKVLDEYRAVVKGSVEEIWTIMPDLMAPPKE